MIVMPKVRFHKLAALVVLVGFAAWMGTGKFSTVGSATAEAETAKSAGEAPKPPVRTVAVITPPRISHARAIRMSGQTEANQRATLAVRNNGVIDRIYVEEGDRVKAGDIIMALAAEEKTAAIEMARQVLMQREAEYAAAEKLAVTGNIPKLQADNARSGLATARSLLEAAEAEMTRNEVKAPFDGIVDRVPVEPGSSVMQGGEVATVLNLDPVLAVGEVSERDLGYLKIGDEADIRLISGQTVKGKVRYISRDASAQTRTFRIEVAIPNGEGSVPAGMTAEITLRAAPTDAVVLPRSVATLSATGDLGIRAVDKDDKVTFHPIDLVDDTPRGLVLGGIPADARVIVAGQDLVKEGDLVKPVEADAETVKRLAGAAGETQ
jgi:membrane fusion protein, multidrug efflux system